MNKKLSGNPVLQRIFKIKRNTPYWGILSESGIWPMEIRIFYKKLMLYHLLITSDEERIARKILVQQIKNNYSNCWYEEIQVILNKLELNITQTQLEELSKIKWKQMVKNKILSYCI